MEFVVVVVVMDCLRFEFVFYQAKVPIRETWEAMEALVDEGLGETFLRSIYTKPIEACDRI